ncbi:lytic polysaccharide monooxygenase [Apiospora phragmitis]|uniref:Lytic polysaccharide monooxygenase n=1 Tax=Apiospora phragmitis TaxID=2905665 RepID=A0ABR1WVX9_9PEZI
MRVSHILTLAVALAAETVLGHMNMADPPPLRYKGNPNAVKAGKVDSDITSPNTAATFPCKGALPDLDDPVAGASVATWYPGEQHTVNIVGGASHNGGSCQLSLSYDKGQTFTVVFSKIGACPTDPNIPFTLPADTPSADKVLFSWSWINHTGNREFYNNCAVLTIGAAKKKQRAAPAVAFKDRPPMLVANIYHTAGSACVKEGVDALYPEPGPDFVNVSSSAELPDDCVSGQPLTANPVVGGSGGSSGSGGASGASGASGSASAPAGPGATESVLPGQLPTTSAPLYVLSSSSFSSSLSSLLPSPSMFSSLLLPLPSSSLQSSHSLSPSSPLTSSASSASATASSPVDRESTLVTSTKSASPSSSSSAAVAPPSSLVVIPITTSRRTHTASPLPSTTSCSAQSTLLTSSSLSSSFSSSSPGDTFATSSIATASSTTVLSTVSSTASATASSSASSPGGSEAAPPTNTPTPSSPNATPSVGPTTSSSSATSSEVVGLPSQSVTVTVTASSSSAAPPSATGGAGGGSTLSGPCQPRGRVELLDRRRVVAALRLGALVGRHAHGAGDEVYAGPE